MDRQAFKLRMQNLKSYRENNPGKGYWDWRNSLPDNLKYTDDTEYDMLAAYEAGVDAEYVEEDRSYHLPTRDPKTGYIFKKSIHPTLWKGLAEDAKLGYDAYFLGDKVYTKSKGEGPIKAFADGGVSDNLVGSYSNHTGTTTMYVPVTKEYEAVPEGFGEIANVHTPEVTITPLNNISLVLAVDKGRRNAFEYIKEAASYTPIVGDAMGASDAVYQATLGNYSEAALAAGLMLLPNFIKKPLKRVGKLLKKNKKIISELQLDDVRNWTDSDWDSNYNLAINDGDKDKVLKIRDLHFISKAPNNNISIRNGKPTTWFHGSPYAGHTTFNSSVFNNTIGGESALGREKGNFFTTDLNAAKNYATGPSAKSEFSEYTKPKNAKEKILDAIGLYEPKYIHPVDRIPEDLGIDVKNMHNYEVSPLLLIDMSYSSNSKAYQSNKIYPTYINPGKTYTVDFEGNPWSQSPVKFPSKYYSRETYPDVDLVPSKNYPEGHFVEKRNTSNLTKDLDELKLELNSLDLPYNNVYYDGSGNESLYGKYRGWNSKLEPKNLISEYPDYRTRPGYSYSIFEHKYPNTTNGAVLYGASENFNTIHITNVVDANTGHYENYPIEDLIPLSSNLIKLANPITYDSSGKIIPISKRDNFTNPDIRYGLIPLIGFSALNYNDNSSAEEYKNRKYSEGGLTGDPEKERFYQATGRSSSGRPLEEGLKPVFDLEDAANMTPIGDAISAKDTYNAVMNRDWLGAGLAAATMIPFVPMTVKLFRGKYRGITPKSNYGANSKLLDLKVLRLIDALATERARREAIMNQSSELTSQANNEGYRIIERLMEDPSYLERAREVKRTFGDDYTKVYSDLIQDYNITPDLLPKSVLDLNLPGRAKMRAKDSAQARVNKGGTPPGRGEFEYAIDPLSTDLTGDVTLHELNHYTDFVKNKSPHADANSNLFYLMNKDMDGVKVDAHDSYFKLPTELKAYMNQLREYLFNSGKINRRNDKVSSSIIKQALEDIKNKPEYDSVIRASKLFKSLKSYTKWFNTIPLLSATTLGANAYFNNEKNK